MPSIGLVCGWPQSAFKGRAKKAKNKNEFKQKEEEDVYSFQRIAGDSTRVHVTWAPSKKRTKEPIINVEHLITESSKPVFQSGAEVVLEDDSDLELTAEQAAQNKQRCIDAKKDAKSGKHKREVLSRMKMKDASYTMHIIPAYFDTNLCRDPMIKTQDATAKRGPPVARTCKRASGRCYRKTRTVRRCTGCSKKIQWQPRSAFETPALAL
jgi:hypothetical protein